MRGRRARKGKVDFVPNVDIEAWLNGNPGALITCPNQPGNLKITPASCMKRHQTANDPKYSNIGAEPFHLFVFKMNLVPCRDCEVGAQLVAQSQKQTKAA